MKTEISDIELRKMRDTVYPAQCAKQIQDDDSWNAVKANWRQDGAWLVEEYRKVMRTSSVSASSVSAKAAES